MGKKIYKVPEVAQGSLLACYKKPEDLMGGLALFGVALLGLAVSRRRAKSSISV